MQFLALPPSDPRCVGAVLAHAVGVGGGKGKRLAKGTQLTQEQLDALQHSGVQQLTVAVLEAGDIGEDDAATRLAQRLASGCDEIVAHQATTGRVNLFARSAGVLALDVAAIHAFNRVDPSITVATLPAFARVDAGQMVATVKIIPFAVPEHLVAMVELTLSPTSFRLAPFGSGRRCLLVQTQLPTIKPSVLDKTALLTAERLAAIGCDAFTERRCDHRAETLAALLSADANNFDLVIIFGASAVADRDDVIPASIVASGGRVQRVGMPVDPGNLLVVGQLGETMILGAPGCARSPKRNGFDWVIERWSAGLPINNEAIASMGVGGLLAEIEDRPRPRAKP